MPGPETLRLVVWTLKIVLALVTIVIDVRDRLRSRMARGHRRPMQLSTG